MIHDLNNLRDSAYKNACDHGFHNEILSDEHWLCLVISELMEAVEADRKGKRAKISKFDIEYLRYHSIVDQNTRFWCSFEKHIKDSLEDELADAAIRLLDLAGLRNIDIEKFTDEQIDDLSESCNDETFTESIYSISIIPIRYEYEYGYKIDKQLNSMLLAILGLAKHLNIDIMWHIEQKVKYNELRPYKHGKQY